mmetsp:Transcript_75979/g.180728  ORF Transcript_75979/g.180728 Transcript_75979/m.180728 type:complete len:355 (+) Transcript_75979:83-1147(+)|eukprot:CAMPEP_0178452648 /NCGR_PEP_ID=MMETSP0689_2-20121128/44360_1 /TAXON_ID=160604 /ORGANISM="Amphidinium massartii, Strain CS-259" /LENGTH=354 /DNA_ID=CAMNT_0020078375 /DNA_START=68 /DNA_END=1132 /DNA_ORIENTATION=-
MYQSAPSTAPPDGDEEEVLDEVLDAFDFTSLEESDTRKLPENARRSANYMFTIAVCCTYMAPVMIAIHLGSDKDVQYWIGDTGLWASVLPIFFVAAYFYNLRELPRGAPSAFCLLLVTLIPCVFFAVVGGMYKTSATYLYGQLKAEDCVGGGYFDQKPKLHQSYLLAKDIYARCAHRIFEENDFQPLPRQPTLWDCEEFTTVYDGTSMGDEGMATFLWKYFPTFMEAEEEVATAMEPWQGYPLKDGSGPKSEHAPEAIERMLATRADWEYLAWIEINHLCGGVCEAGPMLWTSFDKAGRQEPGKCAPYLALKFLVVEFEATMIMWTPFIMLLCSLPVLGMLRSAATKSGKALIV